MTRLVAAGDFDFAWMIDGQGRHPSRQLSLPPGGVDDPIVLAWLRQLSGTQGCAVWMVVADDEVVGLCSYKGPPSPDGAVEIGYGIALSRQAHGHGRRAVALLVAAAAADPMVARITAETASDNIASERVLEHAGFARTGTRTCEEDGSLVCWSLMVA